MFGDGKKSWKFRRGRQLFLFLFCLFLAFIIWVVHNLSDEYSQFFEYKVFLSVQIKGHETTSGSLNNLVIRGKSNGFYIIKHRFNASDNFLTLKLDSKFVKRKRDVEDGFYLIVSDVRDLIVEAVAEKMSIEYFSVDTLFFDFPQIAGKEVPVSVRSRLSFHEQYMPESGFKLNPSHVFISGERKRLEEIDTVYTEMVVENGIDSDLTGFVGLDLPEEVSATESEIYYTLDVVRFVEERFNKSVQIKDLPDSIDVELLPKEIKVVFRYRKDDDDINGLELIYPEVDFNYYRINSDTVVKPVLSGELPEGLLYAECMPRFVYVRVIKD